MKRKKYIIYFAVIIWSLIFPQAIFADNLHNGEGIRIGIIDTGIMGNYRIEFQEKIVQGKNYVFPEEGLEDKIGHGTRVASVILGVKNDKNILIGTAPKATIVPLIYQSRYPSGVTKNGGLELLIKAMRDAIDVYHCKVLCISSGTTKDDDNLRETVEYAEEKGVIIVAAVGNDNERAAEKIYYPAAYDTVIGVGAIDGNDEIAEFSQRNGVFCVTQGKNIKALSLDENVRCFSGTSYANASAAGIIASLLSEAPSSTPKDIRNTISISAEDLGDKGYDSVYGWGKINSASALKFLKNIN
ncbi:S8 family peptidase [Anaerovorax odorimutans]|uniref:S8 family peptidase n=1 Tax=Anaerovorax odorimutans TaxID=109327 RepID=UPI00146CBB42|nr:S8 family peptidase [Anaerovorax odorimutans]